VWEFAVAVNRSESAALEIAKNGTSVAIPIDGLDVRKLLGTVWFRGVAPRLSEEWRARLLEALVRDVVVVNHVVKVGRRVTSLSALTGAELRELATNLSLPDFLRPELDLLATIERLWGDGTVARMRFSEVTPREPSRLASLFVGLRG
jgi:hypothetical protein